MQLQRLPAQVTKELSAERNLAFSLLGSSHFYSKGRMNLNETERSTEPKNAIELLLHLLLRLVSFFVSLPSVGLFLLHYSLPFISLSRWFTCLTHLLVLSFSFPFFTVTVLDVHAFERLLGPCMDIMKRNFNHYEEQLVKIFGSKANISDLR